MGRYHIFLSALIKCRSALFGDSSPVSLGGDLREEAELKHGKTAQLRTRTRSVLQDAPKPESEPCTKEMEAEQRMVIKFFYRKAGSPPEEDWDNQDGTISRIRRQMGDKPPGSATVK